ncbi:MAG: hypothetical protein ACREO3_11205 [Arenimonas sp.]
MSSYTDRWARDALALLQLDSAARDPLVGDHGPGLASGPANGLAETLAAEDHGSEADDAYWRELHLRQLAEGGGCDYDEVDPGNWIHRTRAAPEPAGSLPGPAENLQRDFDRIVGRLR